MGLFIIGLIYLGILIYLANMQDLTRQSSVWVSMMMMGLPFTTLYLGMGTTIAIPDAAPALAIGVLSSLLAGLGFAVIHSEEFRNRLARLTTHDEEDKPKVAPFRYRPDSAVHNVALLIALLTIMYHVSTFFILGGSAGVAEALASDNSPLLSALTNGVLELFMALLGVGLFIRRNEWQTLERLGLRWPTRHDVISGLVAAVVLLVLAYGIASLISLFTPPSLAEEQYAAVEAVNAPLLASLLIAFVSAIIYGACEEILYRGALQPIFGLVPTALLFMLVHVQYLFTPAMLIILLVGLGLGLVRQRFSTSASIIAHIAYNALPFIVVAVVGGSA